MKDKYETDWQRMFTLMGARWRDNRAFKKFAKKTQYGMPDVASPDLFVIYKKYGFMLEVKTGFDNRFDFSSWTQKQRDYAKECREDGIEYWIGLSIETPYHNHDAPNPRSNAKKMPRMSFLIPSEKFEWVISQFDSDSVVYKRQKGSGKDLAFYLYDWALDYSHKTKTITIPSKHLFWGIYE